MLDRIEMDVIQMPGEIVLITNDVIIESVLPPRARQTGDGFETPGHLPFYGGHDLWQMGRVIRFEQPMEVVRQYDMRQVAIAVNGVDRPHGGEQNPHGSFVGEPWIPAMGDQSNEDGVTGKIIPSKARHEIKSIGGS